MYSVAAKVQELDYFTRLNKEFKSDLYWWHLFLDKWNGTSFLQPKKSIPILTFQTGAWGCAGFFHCKWFQLQWTQEWLLKAIMVKELIPIVISCAIWGPLLWHKSILFQCDNTGVSYQTGQHRYLTFCSNIKKSLLPTTEDTLLLFVSHLAQQGPSHASIKVYLSAICNLHVSSGLHEEFAKQLTPRLELVLKGIKK